MIIILKFFIFPVFIRLILLCVLVKLKQYNRELFYKFSPILMQNIPEETVNVWIKQKDQLDPKRLIPALVQYNHNKYAVQVGTNKCTEITRVISVFCRYIFSRRMMWVCFNLTVIIYALNSGDLWLICICHFVLNCQLWNYALFLFIRKLFQRSLEVKSVVNIKLKSQTEVLWSSHTICFYCWNIWI